MTLVELRALEVFGHHGVGEDERRAGQRFLFDVELAVPDGAAASDRLEDTVDYREVAACIRDVSDGRQFTLLEGLAGAVADELVRRFRVQRARVRVRKPDLGRVSDLAVEYTAATVERPAAGA